ncbi:MAG: alpha/beta fold hydrolase [Elusimicrobia bacterium]|nr:alpha/beta fold hydrolase [Elusimicrobiota bacterium]
MRRPYRKGRLPVGDGHELYYEGWGNPKGVPIVSLHGGPGGGFTDRTKRLFDPRRHNLVLFDQRGAGRSRPFASVRANTTAHLVRDTDKVMDLFGLERAVLTGGSWGTTLALAYALSRPRRVAGLVLCSLFLGDADAIRHYIGGGLRTHFPDRWERFLSLVPARHRRNPSAYYLSRMRSKDPRVSERYCYEWAYYEMSVVSLDVPHETVLKYMKEFSYRSLAPLEAHYMANGCFLPRGHILKNARRLSRVPTALLHGRYDVICPPVQAWEFKRRHGNVDLSFYPGGHYEEGPERKAAFKKALAGVAAASGLAGRAAANR